MGQDVRNPADASRGVPREEGRAQRATTWARRRRGSRASSRRWGSRTRSRSRPGLSMVAGISGRPADDERGAENLQQGVVVDLPHGDTSGIDPQVGVFYSLPDSGRVRATYSHKTRLPTMSDRYSHKFGFAIPNPELKPERSDTFETGYQGTAGARTTYDVTVFYSRITDLIQPFYLSPNLTQQSEHRTRLRSRLRGGDANSACLAGRRQFQLRVPPAQEPERPRRAAHRRPAAQGALLGQRRSR